MAHCIKLEDDSSSNDICSSAQSVGIPYYEVATNSMGHWQSDCNKAFDKDMAGSLPTFACQSVLQSHVYRRRSSSIASINDDKQSVAKTVDPVPSKHATLKSRSNNWLLDVLKFRRSQDSSDSDSGFTGGVSVPVNAHVKQIKRKSIYKRHNETDVSDTPKHTNYSRSPTFAHRIKKLMTRNETNLLSVKLNSDKSFSDSDLFGFNHLHPKLQATSSTESDVSLGKRHSINSTNVGFSAFSSLSQPTITAFADALNSAPRFRLTSTQHDRNHVPAKSEHFSGINDASTVVALTFKKTDAIVFVCEDSEMKYGVDYEMFYVEQYNNHLQNVARNCHSSSEYFSDIRLILQQINTVTKDALKIKQATENKTAGRRTHRSFSVDCGFTSVTSAQDEQLHCALASQRCNTPSNISAVLMRLRSPSKKTRSNSMSGLQTLLPGCTLGLVDQCQVLMTQLIKGKVKQKFKSRQLILFTDRIIIFKTKKEQMFDQSCINLIWLSDGAIEAAQSSCSNTLVLGWPMVNYSVRYESAETCLLWKHLLNETIEQSRAKDVDKPRTLPIQIVLDLQHKDAVLLGETLGSVKTIQVGPTDNADSCLQCALFAFNMTENYSLANTQLFCATNSSETKLMSHEIPYWIMLWSVHRYHLASSGAINIDSHGNSVKELLSRQMSCSSDDDSYFSTSLLETAVVESTKESHRNNPTGKIKFLLRQKKAKPRPITSGSEVDDLTKTRLKSRKGLTQLLSIVGRSKAEELDSYEASKVLTTVEGRIFGRSLNDICPNGVIGPAIMGLLGYVYAHIPYMEGPFRVTGNFTHIKQLQAILEKAESNSNVFLNSLFELKNVGCPSPATVLGLLKKFCANVPDQLLQRSQIKYWMEACRESNVDARLVLIKKILANLPPANARFLELLLCICVHVVNHADITRLNESGLSTSLGPSLLTPLDPVDVEAQYQINELFGFLITHFDTLWPNSDASQVLKDANPNSFCDNSSVDSIDIENGNNKKFGTTVNAISSPSSLSRDSGLYSSDQQFYGNECESSTSVAIQRRKSTPPPPLLPPESPPPLNLSHLTKALSPHQVIVSPSAEFNHPQCHPTYAPPIIRLKKSPELILSPPTISVDQMNTTFVSRSSRYSVNDTNSTIIRSIAPPPYQKAVERQLQLRLGNNSVSKVDKSVHMPHRSRSAERRRGSTSSCAAPLDKQSVDQLSVQPNSTRLHRSPRVEDVEYAPSIESDVLKPSTNFADVVERRGSPPQSRQLPHEVETLLYGEEVSYV